MKTAAQIIRDVERAGPCWVLYRTTLGIPRKLDSYLADEPAVDAAKDKLLEALERAEADMPNGTYSIDLKPNRTAHGRSVTTADFTVTPPATNAGMGGLQGTTGQAVTPEMLHQLLTIERQQADLRMEKLLLERDRRDFEEQRREELKNWKEEKAHYDSKEARLEGALGRLAGSLMDAYLDGGLGGALGQLSAYSAPASPALGSVAVASVEAVETVEPLADTPDPAAAYDWRAHAATQMVQLLDNPDQARKLLAAAHLVKRQADQPTEPTIPIHTPQAEAEAV